MQERRIVFLSGLPPDTSGTGQFISWLKSQGAYVVHSSQISIQGMSLSRIRRYVGRTTVRLLASRHNLPENLGNAREGRFYMLRSILSSILFSPIIRIHFYLRMALIAQDDHSDVVFLHPQNIGMSRMLKFIERRTRPPYLYLLDSSYFCVRSYNHLDGEKKPCTECLGGNFTSATFNGCTPFPVEDKDAFEFVESIHNLVKSGMLKLLAQCESQAMIAERHFGVKVPVVGLWTSDVDDVFDDLLSKAPLPFEARYHVLFHGHWVEAKGANWVIEVAKNSPELKYLLPFPRPHALQDLPDNVECIPMTWDNGLAELVSQVPFVLVPSLWSAPVESALVKSIAKARAVAVVDNSSSFSSEIPDNIVMPLPQDPKTAASKLSNAIKSDWHPDADDLLDWLTAWKLSNLNVLDNIKKTVNLHG